MDLSLPIAADAGPVEAQEQSKHAGNLGASQHRGLSLRMSLFVCIHTASILSVFQPTTDQYRTVSAANAIRCISKSRKETAWCQAASACNPGGKASNLLLVRDPSAPNRLSQAPTNSSALA
ncbi:hypothetical protein Cob_v005395 [Colletotrichum orbiculare MAFF 240422]|uniref:Uncharacterized protein n=1 Tax=Colletotrichum orbiculare (strain 104-T / ATCC 96160 / CBS 514.97 / LARS 414 / MAFF 240422) TaxID=1213857 RepID=A0A484FTP3_COLOR|nr:hypothetical protein Cob_v005395 [Colletotrichum orbiculare MAFF 240422]